ncbi:voltage-gated potassium channel [Texcoconibacillus texcoconensis]|uniref:Voltage-gated potassium channel n=2 Tax=Texcoconibacillus texcoconensis TaxID=1095777 RepID=A0A840QNB5_9BACI|nr:voltage-gated potassium channel [Texcoconibacillus texcoconensis]
MSRFQQWAHTYAKFPTFVRLLLIVFVIVTSFGVAIHQLETETFPNVIDGIWWAIVTTSTVGYGDFVPQTLLGRALAAGLILFGIAFFTIFVTNLAQTAVTTRNMFHKGELEYKKEGHYIVIGWNERTKKVISQLIKKQNVHIVLIDKSLEGNPISEKKVHFIKGSSLNDDTLKKANIAHARTVIISADHDLGENQADSHSILTLIAAKALNPSVYSIVEMLTPEQVKNARRAGADEVIETSNLSSLAMLNCTKYHGMTEVIGRLLEVETRDRLVYKYVPDEFFQKTFAEISYFMAKNDDFVVGLIRNQEFLFHPLPSTKLIKGDQMVVIDR